MEFTVLTAQGATPSKRAYHSCSVIGNSIFIFGGIQDDKTVLNDIHRYDVESNSWTQMENRRLRGSPSNPEVSRTFPRGRLCEAPFASHHTATIARERYIIIIGGWNGRKRVADIHCFDTTNSTWRRIPENGEVPVGLSSHTASLVSPKDILIIGREGGVHTQRRFSGAFKVDIETGKYTEAPFQAASRSGHSASLIRVRASKEHYLFVFGGRKSGSYELLGRWNHVENPTHSIPQVKIDRLLGKCKVCGEPEGRQHGQCVQIGRYLLIFGGEKWSGVREHVTNESFLLDSQEMTWYAIPVSNQIPKLVGHSMCGVGENVLVFGGKLDNKACETLFKVDIFD